MLETASLVTLKYFDKDGRFIPKALGDELIQENKVLTVNDTSEIFVFNGRFYESGEKILETQSATKLDHKFKKASMADTMAYIRAMTYRNRKDNALPENLLPIENGLLDIHTREITPHTPDYFYTSLHPLHYDPEAKCPKIDAFLGQVLLPEDVQIGVELFAYVLVRSVPNPFEKTVMLYGTGGNGKGTFLNLLTEFLGEQNVSSVPLHALCSGNLFFSSQLYGKMANVCADLPPRALLDSAEFKKITTGDPITAQSKFQEPFSFRPYAKMLYSANQMPATKDYSEAFFDRWLVLPFPNKWRVAGKKDSKKIKKISSKEELSGLLNKALDVLPALLERAEFTTTASTKNSRREYLLRADVCTIYLEECLEPGPGSTIKKDDLYEKFVDFTEEQGEEKPPLRDVFFQRLRRAYPRAKAVRLAADENKKRPWAFEGVKLKESDENKTGENKPPLSPAQKQLLDA